MNIHTKQLSAFLTTCLMLALVNITNAQTDPHFTQNYTFSSTINPALTGSSDGEYRVSAVFRTQWGGTINPYSTKGVSYDTRTDKNIAIGASILNQTAGDGGFSYTNAYGSFAYTGIKFGTENEHHLVLALQAGLINRRVDPSKFKWGEQWNPITGYNASNLPSETFASTSSATFDMGAGALYYNASPEKKYNLFGGFSAFHINRPKDPIISSHETELNNIPMRYVLHGGVSYNLSNIARVVPNILLMKQGTAIEAMLGTYIQLNVNEETDFMFGGYYRYKDAVAPYIGVDWRNFTIGLSYDLNTSQLGAMTRNVNSFELSVSYIKRSSSKSVFDYIHCPRF